MSISNAKTIVEYSGVSADQFRSEIYPKAQPAIMRGLAADWPLVEAGQQSKNTLIAQLKGMDSGQAVTVLEGSPAMQRSDGSSRAFFYNADLQTMNFQRHQMTLSAMLDRLAHGMDAPFYLQSTPTSKLLPAFSQQNGLRFLTESIPALIWIGNATTVQTHFDLSQNIACVVAGRRRFTLFPPEQLGNLYMGPFENTPAGTPISLVDLDNPDYQRFPRFKAAAENALVADLGPGDAIFIPYFWWHHVRALEPFNILVNYWWNEYAAMGSPMDTMLHALLTLRDLPAPMKVGWKQMFDEYVFADKAAEPEHIPPAARGGLGAMSGQMRGQYWQALARNVAGFFQHITGQGRR